MSLPRTPFTSRSLFRSTNTVICVLSVTLAIALSTMSVALASPADPDRPIPSALKKIPYKDMRVKASSVARGFSSRNLFRMKAWRAWGSDPQEREGAWVRFYWPKVYYIDTIHYVPGDERAPGFFDHECGRPAQLRVRGDLETRKVDLEDIRGHQYITFNPPLVTRSLEFLITDVRGQSKSGGVCFAAVSFYAHRRPMKSIEGLKARAEEAMNQLSSPLKRSRARATLKRVGPAVAPLLLQEIRESRGTRQRQLLEVAPELLAASDLKDLNQLKSQITADTLGAFLRARASLGDESATAELLANLDTLKPSEQASVLSSVARAREASRLSFLLTYYGIHPEVDEALRVHLPYIEGAYQGAFKLYKSSNGQRRAAMLELLAKVDPKQAAPLIKRALGQREDSMLRSGAIRGAAYSDDHKLRPLIRRLMSSVYVIERRAVAFTLSQWRDPEDGDRLRELASDKAMSVRQEALRGLGRLGNADDFLKNYALYGSDESTAETAARAWLSGEARQNVKTSLKLLSSPFERVRAYALSALSEHREAACQPLVHEILRVDPIYTEHVNILRDLWSVCSTPFVEISLASSITAQGRALSIAQELQLPELKPLIIKLAATDDPELQVALANASGVLTLSEADKVLGRHLESEYVTTRCAALGALSKKQSKLTLQIIKESIKSGLSDPYRADRAMLLCAIDAAGEYPSGEFAPLLGEAYQSWSRSLGFVSYRLKAIAALKRLPTSPARLETLIKASTDIDRKVRKSALEGLRSSPKR